MKMLFACMLCAWSLLLHSQSAFNQYPAVPHLELSDWQVHTVNQNPQQYSLDVPAFFSGHTLGVWLQPDRANPATATEIALNFNGMLIQRLNEDIPFSSLNFRESTRIADFDGDGRTDIKILISYLGEGIEVLKVRVIYLFQFSRQSFTKISFDDMMVGNRLERDLDGDQNFEIVTMNFKEYDGKNYCTYNLFELQNKHLVNVNDKGDFPIIELCLEPESPEITDHLSKDKLKTFVLRQPKNYQQARD